MTMVPIPENYESVEWFGELHQHHPDVQPDMVRSLIFANAWAVFCPQCGYMAAGSTADMAAETWNKRVMSHQGDTLD